jgi:hypothetical protein
MLDSGAIVISLLLVLGPFESGAFAYQDPGTGSLILQIILGGAAGGLVIIRMTSRKAWNWLRSLFTGKSGKH